MDRNLLVQQIKQFLPWNAQEEIDKEILLSLLQTQDDIFMRSHLTYHISSSAWVINRERTHVLMAYHNIYQSYSWLGGHNDGEIDCKKVAEREVKEESGISHVHLLLDEIFSIEILPVSGHEKHGEYVPSHLHINITYLFEGEDNDQLSIKQDENSDVKWIPIDELESYITEPWMYERIYSKLIQKAKEKLQ